MRWLECENAHLRKYWRRRKPEQLASELGRPVGGVQRQAYKLGLGKGWQPDYKRGYATNAPWTPERDAEMLRLLGTVDEELVRRTGRTLGAIESRISNLARR